MNKLSLSLGTWTFAPGLMSSCITLLLIPCFVYLGYWQLDRAALKTELEQTFTNHLKAPILPFSALFTTEDPEKLAKKFRYRRVQVKGYFINQFTFFLDNQIVEGKVGYKVFTPFKPHDSPTLLLIDRGWVPIVNSRSHLPSIHPIKGEVTVIGMINLPSHGLKLKSAKSQSNQWPLVVQYLDFKVLSIHFKQNFYPFLLQTESKTAFSYQVPPITFTVSAKRHLGYAIQWFTIAFATLIYYLGINSYRIKHVKL